MATLTITLTGSAIVNGTKVYTVTDADIQSVLDWAANDYARFLPTTPTNGQILLQWLHQTLIETTKAKVQMFKTVQQLPIVPPPVGFN